MPDPRNNMGSQQAAGDKADKVAGGGKANLGRSKTLNLGPQGQQGQHQAMANQQQGIGTEQGGDG